MKDWTEFDLSASKARQARKDHGDFLTECDSKYGTTYDYQRLSGGHHVSWSPDDKERSRNLVRIAQDAEYSTLALKPPRVHMATARKRLRYIMLHGKSPLN